MGYRQLSYGDLQGLAQKVAFADLWTEYARYAKNLYGESAVRLVVSTEEQYNDEGYDTVLESIEIFDKDNNDLSLDFETSWWKKCNESFTPYEDSDCEITLEDLKDEKAREERYSLPVPPTSPMTFYIGESPFATIPAVFVQDDE